MSVITKLYIMLYCLAAAVFAIGGGYIIWKKRRNIPHDCTTCAHCVLIERGADGKPIYTCGIDRGKEPKVYYEKAIPLYCGWWNRWEEKTGFTSAEKDETVRLVTALRKELDLFHAEREEREKKSKILTVRELRKMIGEPVYLKSKGEDFEEGWYIVNSVGKVDVYFRSYVKLQWENYGKTWAAYRCEPEEGSENG